MRPLNAGKIADMDTVWLQSVPLNIAILIFNCHFCYSQHIYNPFMLTQYLQYIRQRHTCIHSTGLQCATEHCFRLTSSAVKHCDPITEKARRFLETVTQSVNGASAANRARSQHGAAVSSAVGLGRQGIRKENSTTKVHCPCCSRRNTPN